MLSLLTSTIAGTRWHELASYGFAEYKAEFGKAYATVEEEAQREANFLQRLKAIKAHNADPTQTYKRGVNPFTDRTLDELRPLHGLDRALLFSERAQEPVESMTKPWKANEYPAGVDWRRRGAVTPVKNQGQCGSCWTVTDASLSNSAASSLPSHCTPHHTLVCSRVLSCALVCACACACALMRPRVRSSPRPRPSSLAGSSRRASCRSSPSSLSSTAHPILRTAVARAAAPAAQPSSLTSGSPRWAGCRANGPTRTKASPAMPAPATGCPSPRLSRSRTAERWPRRPTSPATSRCRRTRMMR